MKLENYKVRVSNEAESKEAQDLFEQLGCRRGVARVRENGCFVGSFDDNEKGWYSSTSIHPLPDHKELTISQLRDLVVLHRNDVSDANMQDDGGFKWLVNKMGSYVFDCGQWVDKSIDALCYNLKPITKEKTMPMHCADVVSDSVLISGKEAFLSHMDGKEVQWRDGELNGDWVDWHETTSWSSTGLNNPAYQFRIKPKTLTIGDKEYTKQEALDFIEEYFK